MPASTQAQRGPGRPPGSSQKRNRRRTPHAIIKLSEPVGEQLKEIRLNQNVNLPMMAELMGWSARSGPANIHHLEGGKGGFATSKELPAIGTITKYLRALDVQRVTFIL